MEEQGSAGGAERQVTKLVEDDEIGVGEPRRDLAGFALKLLLFERVDEFDGGEEPDALAVMLDGLDASSTAASTACSLCCAMRPAQSPGGCPSAGICGPCFSTA